MEKNHGLFYFIGENSNLKVPQNLSEELPLPYETKTTLPRCSFAPFA